MSVLGRLATDASNAAKDAYGSLVLGDEAGKSAQLILVIKPRRYSLDLGMTFLEINGRAYVKTVTKDSEAHKAGILPRDAVQFATVYKKEWSNNQGDETARSYVIECEKKGFRITYEGLKTMLVEGMDPQAFSTSNTDTSKWKGPPIPASVSVCNPPNDDYLRPGSPFTQDAPRPVIFVLRRTRQRPTTNSIVGFRLDDECDFACSLIRRLAPTADMDMPSPDTWEELVHDGTDWLLGSGSILPPKHTANPNSTKVTEPDSIPYDSYEQQRATKLAKLRARMAAETPHYDRAEDVEAATIRGMIQKAVGLAFVRASKVVLGVSIHGGSGIVIARLSDGTWSAPSAIGTWGLGLGVQFGLEVAEYIFILQTQESLEHFRKGGAFTIGGNVGAALAGMGREAYGAASVGNFCTPTQLPKEDEYVDDDHRTSVGIAPIVAYAKSQGLYVGVSLEGSRIFTREEINARAYKFGIGREVSAYDILSGKVATPPEAENLYASLHSVEFTHEMSCLPRPPQILRRDSPHPWQYDRCTLSDKSNGEPFGFLQQMRPEEAEECATFETQFKKFMYGGVSVQRLLPDSESRQRTRRERRTLWLMLPEIGALRLGFVSKLSDDEGAAVSNKSSTQRAKLNGENSIAEEVGTVASGEVTIDSKMDKEGRIQTSNIQLSQKHSLALTDVTTLSQDPDVPIRFNPEDQTEHLRVISIQDVSGTSLIFLANNFREAELLVCGLKLLLERETNRLGVRGGLPITALGGRARDGAMSPSAARGFKEAPIVVTKPRSKPRASKGGYVSSDMDDDDVGTKLTTESSILSHRRPSVPEGRKSWGAVPGRNYMRGQATVESPPEHLSVPSRRGIPKYVHGQLLVRDIATDVQLPLPLPLCRVLLLDSTSPVIAKWESDRGDSNFQRTDWTFPPATPRELERHSSEHHLIASGSMMGAHRTTTFDRPRNGTIVRLSETQIIDADDSEKLAFTVSERMPRRGFSIKVRILLRSVSESSCEAAVMGEVRPVGKNMSNQGAVHKAFFLVLEEIKGRYGTEDHGLMAGFINVVTTLPNSDLHRKTRGPHGKEVSFNPFPRTTDPVRGGNNASSGTKNGQNGIKQRESGLVSLDDMIRNQQPERPSTPSLHIQERTSSKPKKLSPEENNSSFNDYPADEDRPVTIEVKPLPKIRLSLMPAPREEDEDDSSVEPKVIKKKKKKSRRRTSAEKTKPSPEAAPRRLSRRTLRGFEDREF